MSSTAVCCGEVNCCMMRKVVFDDIFARVFICLVTIQTVDSDFRSATKHVESFNAAKSSITTFVGPLHHHAEESKC
jgi:hypothetical protein